MESTIMKWVPENWDKSGMGASSWIKQVELERNSEEFKQLQFEIRRALGKDEKYIRTIERNQSIYDYGQVLIREQLLLSLHKNTTYYRVRRYIKIRYNYLQTALKYNVDHRRCGMSSIIFHSSIPDLTSQDILLVIQVITSDQHSRHITPTNSADYYIEYIAKF